LRETYTSTTEIFCRKFAENDILRETLILLILMTRAMSPSIKLSPLPIDSILEQVRSIITAGHDLILKASPGSGKTTRIPPALLDVVKGQIWVLEPRRVAARMSALRIAKERGEEPGKTIGWQMRFDREYCAETRILFLTEGMLTARLAQDPFLKDVGCIILDEFHERHQQTDIAFALCRNLQTTIRSDLRLVIMSATLDTKSLTAQLPAAKLINLDIPLYPVEVRHEVRDNQIPLPEHVTDITTKLISQSPGGHILVFLPGTAEIIRTKNLLLKRLQDHDCVIMELRGTLDKKTQDLAFQESSKRKVILATNIAESSITIPGVTAVIDSGLAKVPNFNLFSGLTILETRPVSKASLIQRSGRAGRTGPGIAIRLFSKHDEAARPDIDVPEILRLDLAQIYVAVLWLGSRYAKPLIPSELPWPDPPLPRQWEQAKQLLESLDIVNSDGHLIRNDIATTPLHPRLARFLDACLEESLIDEAPWLTAILANPDEAEPLPGDNSHLGCDVLALYEGVRKHPHMHPNIIKTAQQLIRFTKQRALTDIKSCRQAHMMDLSLPLIKAFPDRIAQTKGSTPQAKWIDATLCVGGDIKIATTSAAAHGDLVVAVEAASTRSTGSASSGTEIQSITRVLVSKASVIKSEHLTRSPSRYLVTEDVTKWDEALGKAQNLRVTKYGVLTLSTTIMGAGTAHHDLHKNSTGNLLAKRLLEGWPKPFEDGNVFESYLIRQKLAFDHGLVTHKWDQDELLQLLVEFICDSSSNYDEVLRCNLNEWIRLCVGEDEFMQLQKLAPTQITVGRGHKVAVNYTADSKPWIAARLQNFFGQSQTPRVLNESLPLTVHLLAPNMRALQVTTDLGSFWKNTYPSLKNEYQRKYPRHFWPDDPMTAEPPAQPVRRPKK